MPFGAKILDLRRGERRLALMASVGLFLTVAAHTMLETARDAVFLAERPTRDLNLAYVAIAAITLLAAVLTGRVTLRIGPRTALVVSLAVTAAASMAFYVPRATPRYAFSLYLFSGLEGAVLAPQFWLLADGLFTVGQARRLFGWITSGGVAGAVAGAGLAAMIAHRHPVTLVLPLAAALFAGAAFAVSTIRPVEAGDVRVRDEDPSPSRESPPALRNDRFLMRIAAIVALSTSAVLVVDYLFKSAAAAAIPAPLLGYFFARYYAVMNAVSLAVQVVVAGRLIRRTGVIGAVAITPLLLFGLGLAAAVGSGVFALVLCLKTCDGALRYSLNRVATELLYVPVPPGTRERAKGFIDGALSRTVQALTALALYALASRGLASPRALALMVVGVAMAWTVVAVTLRRGYLDLFRRGLQTGAIRTDTDALDLDLTSLSVLVEGMASPDPATVVAAIDTLDAYDGAALLPALILYHDAPRVLRRALTIFARTTRTDWVPLAERLLSHADDGVVSASVAALTRAGHFASVKAASKGDSPRIDAYVAFHRALADGDVEVASHPLVAALLASADARGRLARRALVSALAAVASQPDRRVASLVRALLELRELDDDDLAAEELASAVAALRLPELIPACLDRLARRGGRDAIRDALVALGSPALEALASALEDEETDRRVRLHLPRSISRFGTQRAADVLAAQLTVEKHGMVRYKLLRALGQLVAHHDVHVDRDLMVREAEANLTTHLRLVAIRVALAADGVDAAGDDQGARAVLDGLILDKQSQAMERAFRFLQLGHAREDIERVHAAAGSSDKAERSNAAEFLDVLLARSEERGLRGLLRVVVDDASDADRVAAAHDLIPGLVRTRRDALLTLLHDHDEVVVALAAWRARGQRDDKLREEVARAGDENPSVRRVSTALFGRSFDTRTS